MARVSLPSFRGVLRSTDDPNVEEVTWRAEAVLSGALGASVVAVFFLILDLVAGRPLWTPFALGSVFFLDRVPAPDAPIDPVLVLGYTAMHGLVFVTFAAMATFHFDTQTRPRTDFARTALLALALFAAFEISFVVLARLFVPAAIDVLGLLRLTVANVLASIAMAILIVARAARGVGVRDMAPS